MLILYCSLFFLFFTRHFLPHVLDYFLFLIFSLATSFCLSSLCFTSHALSSFGVIPSCYLLLAISDFFAYLFLSSLSYFSEDRFSFVFSVISLDPLPLSFSHYISSFLSISQFLSFTPLRLRPFLLSFITHLFLLLLRTSFFVVFWIFPTPILHRSLVFCIVPRILVFHHLRQLNRSLFTRFLSATFLSVPSRWQLSDAASTTATRRRMDTCNLERGPRFL